jgi:predicted Zn-dependent protease
VIKATLGITSEELDRRFRAWLAPRLSRYTKQYVPDLHAPPLDDARKAARSDPKNAKKQVELALALFADQQEAEGDAVLAEAIRLDPKQPDAHYIKLRRAMREKNVAEADRLIAKMIADGNDGYAVRMKAADVAEAKKDDAREREMLEAAYKLDPTQVEPLQGLYDLAHKKKDEAGELSALGRLAMLDQHDRKVWGLYLQHLVAKGRWDDAVKIGEGALFVDVANPQIHRLYAKALAHTGRFISAIYELNSALISRPRPKDQAAIYDDLARAYDKLKKDDFAQKAREYKKQIESAPAADPGDKQRGGDRGEPMGT